MIATLLKHVCRIDIDISDGLCILKYMTNCCGREVSSSHYRYLVQIRLTFFLKLLHRFYSPYHLNHNALIYKTRSLPPSAQSSFNLILKRNLYAEEKRSFGGHLKFKTIKEASCKQRKFRSACAFLFVSFYILLRFGIGSNESNTSTFWSVNYHVILKK